MRRKLLAGKNEVESLAEFGRTAAPTNGSLDLQAVSDAIAAQTISGTVKCYIQTQDAEFAGEQTARLLIKVVSGDGLTVRGTLLALGSYGPATGYDAGGFMARVFADGETLSGVTAEEGDRIVVEFGHHTAGFAGDAVVSRRGAPSGTSDLPENETETGALVPWIEFSTAILMQA